VRLRKGKLWAELPRWQQLPWHATTGRTETDRWSFASQCDITARK
jgi:hypothetical protein